MFGATFHSIRVAGRPPYRGGFRSFAVRGGGSGRRKARSGTGIVTRDAPPGPMNTSDPWVAVKDPNGSGQIYYWNKNTDETTALGATRPTELTQPQPQRQGFLGIVAEGMAFGTGMHLAGRAVSSMLGGGGNAGGAGQGGAEESGGGNDDEWEV